MDPIIIAALSALASQAIQHGGNWLFGGNEEEQRQPPLFPETRQYQTLNPQQQKLQQSVIQQAMASLNASQNAPDISGIRQRATDRFQSETIPSIAERFVGAGRGSGFQSALGRAGAGLESSLADLDYQSQLGQQNFQQNRLNQLLSTAFGNQPQTIGQYSRPMAPSAGEQSFSALGTQLPALLEQILKNIGGGSSGSKETPEKFAASNINFGPGSPFHNLFNPTSSAFNESFKSAGLGGNYGYGSDQNFMNDFSSYKNRQQV